MKISRKQIKEIAIRLLQENKEFNLSNIRFAFTDSKLDSDFENFENLMNAGDEKSAWKYITNNKRHDQFISLLDKNAQSGETDSRVRGGTDSQLADYKKIYNQLADKFGQKKKSNVKPKPKPKRKAIPNADIEELQELLNEANKEGFDANDYQGKELDEDGLYGSKTRSAIGKFFQDTDVKKALSAEGGLEVPGNYDELAAACQIKKSGTGKTAWIKLSSKIADLNDINGNKYKKMVDIIEVVLHAEGDSESEEGDSESEDEETQDELEGAEKINQEKKAILLALDISSQIDDFWSGVGNGTTEPFTDANLKRLGGKHAGYVGIKGVYLPNDDEALAKKYYEELLFENDYGSMLKELDGLGPVGEALSGYFRDSLKFDIGDNINSTRANDLIWKIPFKGMKPKLPEGTMNDPDITNRETEFKIPASFFDI